MNENRSLSGLLFALIISVLSACNSSPAKEGDVAHQPDRDTIGLLSVKDMQDDLIILWSAIKEMHPGYGRYTSTDSLQRAYDKTYRSIKTALPESRFIDLIYPFLCNVRCGHTQLKHSEGYKSPSNVSVSHLPFEVLVRDHRTWITTHRTPQLTTGSEIISINDVPVSTIVDHGYELYCDDGYNETFKELYLSEYDGFDDVCGHYYHWSYPYHVKVRSKTGEVKSLLVNDSKGDAAVDPSVKKADNYTNWTISKSIPDSRLLLLNSASVALFRSTPFAYPDTLVFKDAFKMIKQNGIKALILDMRHNSGGDLRVATKLLSYLADTTFQIVKDVTSRLPNPAVNSFAGYFDSSVTGGFKMGFTPTVKEGSWYHIEAKPAFGNLYGPFSPDRKEHFSGKLIVLIDGATFSSGALFSAALKVYRKDVIFIGRETAGAEEGCNGVILQKLTLPNTKIVVDFPWMRVASVARHPIPGRGLIPDHIIDQSPEDIVTNNDPDLQKALSIIRIQ